MLENSLFKRTLEYIKPVKGFVALLWFVTIVTTVLELLPTYYMGRIIDLIVDKDFQGVLRIILLLVTFFLISSILSFFETYLSNLLKNKIAYSIKNTFFAKIIGLPTEVFDQVQTGELISRIEEDTATIARFYITDLLNILLAIVTFLVSGFFILKISVPLSLIAVATFPISFLIYYLFGKKIKKLSWEGRKIKDNYFSFVEETLASIREVKCLVIEHKVNEKFQTFSNQFFNNNMRTTISSTFSGLFSSGVSSAFDWLIITYGAWLIIIGQLSIGSFVAFNGYIGKFLNAIQTMLSVNLTVQSMSVALERIYQFMDMESENQDEDTDVEDLHGPININHLQFSYRNSNTDAIRNVCLNLKPNTMSVIVGVNGCGKSTLLNLLVRLYEQGQGSIIIDSQPIEQIRLKSLRKSITYIQQNPYMFNASIKENLLLVNPLATSDEIKEACKKAYIHDYIESLPNKYDTLIGPGGIILSGGQKQKLSIARAVLKKSSILLLDEITSELDGESESEIVQSIIALSEERIVLMVAHRLTSIIDCQNIYVMNEGIIEDKGTHDELIVRCDTYQRLFRKSTLFKKTDNAQKFSVM